MSNRISFMNENEVTRVKVTFSGLRIHRDFSCVVVRPAKKNTLRRSKPKMENSDCPSTGCCEVNKGGKNLNNILII